MRCKWTSLPSVTFAHLIAQLPAFGAIAAAGCGPQLDCICSNDDFFLTLQGVILQGTCTVLEAEGEPCRVRKVDPQNLR